MSDSPSDYDMNRVPSNAQSSGPRRGNLGADAMDCENHDFCPAVPSSLPGAVGPSRDNNKQKEKHRIKRKVTHKTVPKPKRLKRVKKKRKRQVIKTGNTKRHKRTNQPHNKNHNVIIKYQHKQDANLNKFENKLSDEHKMIFLRSVETNTELLRHLSYVMYKNTKHEPLIRRTISDYIKINTEELELLIQRVFTGKPTNV